MTREEALQILDTIPTIGEQVDALELAIEALSTEPCEDCISRKEALRIAELGAKEGLLWLQMQLFILPSVQPKPKWIPVSERLPEDLEPVNITWVNHNPESYYADIKDKPFTATGHYYKGRWYWYSSTCQDYLEEYGRCDVDEIDTDIEVIAWMPLPEPYKESEETNESKHLRNAT